MNKIDDMTEDEIFFYLPIHCPADLKRFRAVSKGKLTFNLAAALFGSIWFAYQFMFLTYAIVVLLDALLNVSISVYIHYHYIVPHEAQIMLLKASVILLLVKAILYGIIGDKLLWQSLKRRIKRDRVNPKHLNSVESVFSKMEASEKRGLARGIVIVISIGILYIVTESVVPMAVAAFFY